MNANPIPIAITLDYSEWLSILDALDEKQFDLSNCDHPEMAEEVATLRTKIEGLIDP